MPHDPFDGNRKPLRRFSRHLSTCEDCETQRNVRFFENLKKFLCVKCYKLRMNDNVRNI